MSKRQLLFLFLFFCFSQVFSAEKTWKGTLNSNWNNSSNWIGGLPSNGDNIIIDGDSTLNPPIISSNSVFIPLNITIRNVDSLVINASLTITGNISIASDSKLTTNNTSNGCVYFNGTSSLLGDGTFVFANVIINNGKTLNHAEPSVIHIKDSWTNNGGTFIPNTNKVVFDGTVVQYINGTVSTQTFYDFEVAKTSQSLRVGGNLDELNVHDFIQTSYKFYDSALTTFNVSGDFIHISGTFVPCDDIFIAGNIIEYSSTTQLEWGANVTLNGTTAQTIGGSYPMTFNNLIINNSGLDGITLEQPVSISVSLTLTDGYIYTDATNVLIIKDGATSSSGSSSSFVNGPLKKIGDDPFVFPVGAEGIWARFEMVGDENFNNYSSTTAFTCTYHHSAPSYNNDPQKMEGGIAYTSFVEYWNLERTFDTDNNAQCNVRLYWEDTAISGITDVSDLLVAHYSSISGLFENQGGNVFASGKSGSLTSTIPLTSFSPLTFGSSSGINPLPVELLYFDAKITEDNKVALTWEVASEINTDYYTILRSYDGVHFEKITEISGTGTCPTNIKYQFTDTDKFEKTVCYYRLCETDLSGVIKNLKEISLRLNIEQPSVVAYPNPIGKCDILTVQVDNEKNINELILIDENGKTACDKINKINTEENKTQLDICDCNLASGIYSLMINNVGTINIVVR